MIKANDPSLKSWVPVPPDSDFPIQNIPFGIAVFPGAKGAVSTRIGDRVLNLERLSALAYLDGLDIEPDVFDSGALNAFIAMGKQKTRAVRDRISELLCRENDTLQSQAEHCERVFAAAEEVEMWMPLQVGDYTDFYSSEQHAYNVGCMFRDPDNALLPNWKHLPVAYHGRASSIVVSGTPLHRPWGQRKPSEQEPPVFSPCKLLDFELEMAFVIGKKTALGQCVTTEEAEDHIFGLCLFNDWSARDIQKWEYVPLGPFLSKNFGSSVSPWIVTLDALEPFRIPSPRQDPAVLPYLRFSGDRHYDISLEVFIEPEGGAAVKVTHSNLKYLYWNMCQQLAHHTVNGCNVNVGDVMASGTISGPSEGQYGSMLEISWKGSGPFRMPDGSARSFIEDGDTVVMRGFGERNGLRIGFGEVSTKILPAKTAL